VAGRIRSNSTFCGLSPHTTRAALLPSGLNNVELLRHSPLPSLKYHCAALSNSTSDYGCHPNVVVPWEFVLQDSGPMPLDDLVNSHTDKLTPRGDYAPPTVPPMDWYSTEDAPYFAFLSMIMSPISSLLEAEYVETQTCCHEELVRNVCWTGHRTSRMTDSQDATDFVPVNLRTKPEFELIHKDTKEIFCTLEVKKM